MAVVLFTSNCKAAGAVERFHYVQELMKYIPVGRCSSHNLIDIAISMQLMTCVFFRSVYSSRILLRKVHSYGKCLNNRQEPEMPEDPKWPAPAQRRARFVHAAQSSFCTIYA